jgi:hypothetical protein
VRGEGGFGSTGINISNNNEKEVKIKVDGKWTNSKLTLS